MKISCCEISGISNEGIRNQFNSKVEFCSFLHFQPSTCSLHIFLLPHRGRYQARWILKCSQQNESPNSKWDKKIQWNAKCTESWCLGYNYTRLGILSNEWMKTFHISIFGLFLIALSFRKNEHRKKKFKYFAMLWNMNELEPRLFHLGENYQTSDLSLKQI